MALIIISGIDEILKLSLEIKAAFDTAQSKNFKYHVCVFFSVK